MLLCEQCELAATGLTLIGLSFACDDKPPKPDDVESAAPAAPATKPAVPVAEQARKPLALGGLPFTANAPESWKVSTHTIPGHDLTMLQGPLDGDEIQLNLAAREDMSADLLKQILARAEREKADKSSEVETRDDGDVRIVSTRRMPSTTQPTAITQPMADPEHVEWRIELYVPSGVRYQKYEINFIGLTPATYLRNKLLLDAVVASIKHDNREAL